MAGPGVFHFIRRLCLVMLLMLVAFGGLGIAVACLLGADFRLHLMGLFGGSMYQYEAQLCDGHV